MKKTGLTKSEHDELAEQTIVMARMLQQMHLFVSLKCGTSKKVTHAAFKAHVVLNQLKAALDDQSCYDNCFDKYRYYPRSENAGVKQ